MDTLKKPSRERSNRLSIRDVKPHPLAERLTGQREDGLPDGVHTGGAWLHAGAVYKPLDGRPWANADHHLPTQEDEILSAFADQPFFPHNWHTESIAGRRFLVRPLARHVDPHSLDDATLHALVAQIAHINAQQWEIGDLLTLGEIGGTLFIIDLSTAHIQRGVCAYAASDDAYLARYLTLAGRAYIWDAILRERTRATLAAMNLEEQEIAAWLDAAYSDKNQNGGTKQ